MNHSMAGNRPARNKSVLSRKRNRFITIIGLVTCLILVSLCIISGCSLRPEPEPGFNSPLLPEELAFYQPPDKYFSISANPGKSPRNIILFIGDGMGFSQVELSRVWGAGRKNRLWMETLPVKGQMVTHNIQSDITDSAAAVTAMACGVKTKNGTIGQTPDGQNWLNISELLRQNGWRTGLVATSAVTHATPAGFASHVVSRGMEEEIAFQMASSGTDVILGGGLKYWQKPETQQRVRRADFSTVTTREELNTIGSLPVLGLFQQKEMTTVKTGEPSIEEMTRNAIRLLSAPRPDGSPAPPFFLMVEGSQIDWACHAHDAKDCVRQTLLFDMAIKTGLDFARASDDTLIVVTADHETGGMSLSYAGDTSRFPKVGWSTSGHTNSNVPVFAFGPGASQFAQTFDNTELPKKFAAFYNLTDFPRAISLTKLQNKQTVLQIAGR